MVNPIVDTNPRHHPLQRSWARLATPLALAYAMFVALVIVATIINPDFASLGNLKAQLIIGAILGTVAIGQTVLIVMGQIDLSIPWTMTASGIIMAALHGEGYGAATAIAAALAVGLVVGIANTIGVALFRVQSLVWTLAINTLLEGLTLVFTNSEPPKSGIPLAARFLAVGEFGWLPAVVLLWIVLGAATLLMIRRTVLGRAIYATGINPVATFFSGIDVRRTYFCGFVISGLGAALGGILLTGYTSEAYLGMGADYLLVPIAAVVIGGTNILGGSGGYAGTIAGVLIMTVLQATLSIVQIAPGGKDIILGLLILCTIIAYGRHEQVRA